MSHFNNVNVGVTGFVFDSRYTFTGLGYLAVCWQKQWGTNTIGSRTTRTEAYPLPYSEFCLPIVSGKGYVGGLNYGFGVGVTNFGLTSVTIANNSEDSGYRWTGYTYIVVGAQQQWGNLWAGYTEVLNWYFPLTTSQVYAVCLTKHTKNISSGHNWEPARIEEWNNSYARIHPDGDLGYSVIAICKAQQQWGIVYAEQGYIIVTLPLAYSSNKYVVIGQDLDYTSNDTDGYGENVGITQVTTTSIRVSITRGRYLSYCTIGF